MKSILFLILILGCILYSCKSNKALNKETDFSFIVLLKKDKTPSDIKKTSINYLDVKAISKSQNKWILNYYGTTQVKENIHTELNKNSIILELSEPDNKLQNSSSTNSQKGRATPIIK